MGGDKRGVERLRQRSVLVFGSGPVRDRVGRRLLAAGASVVAANAAPRPTQPIVGALVSLEALATSACALSLDMFSVVETLERSRVAFPRGTPRVVVVLPSPCIAVPERVGLRLARTLALYLGAPSRVRFNAVQGASTECRAAAREAADLSMTLLGGMLDASRDRVFRIDALPGPTQRRSR